MFCKRANYALVLMVTLAQCYGIEEMTTKKIARQHNPPSVGLKEVAELLEESGLIVRKGGDKLSFNIAPEKITIWQVVACAASKEALECCKNLPYKERTSVVTMIAKEDEFLQGMISLRLKRYKLSAWSNKASEFMYV